MRQILLFGMTFAVVFSIAVGLTAVMAPATQAKPNDCLLTLEPFYYCEPAPRCHEPGEEFCWLCRGWDMYGDPCLCERVGCMIPPQ
jgi:hypothetical protein